jgi:hypothetical protein
MAVLLSGGKPMVARTGRPMASSPANIAPAVVVNPPPTGPTDAQVAQNFVAPLTLGIAIERWRATSLVYQGAAINSSTAYWAYLKSLGFTHVRLVLPWRVSVEMFGGWVNGVQPTDAQLDAFLLAARRAVAAGLRVLYDCTDQLSAADFNANRAAIEQVVDRQAVKIAQLQTELPPSMIAVGAYSELDFLTNTDCNEYRSAAHRILRARLANYVLMTGAAKSNSPAMFGGDWLMVADTRVLLKWHDFPGVPTVTYIQSVRASMEALASGVGGVGIVGGSLAEGTTGYDDGWAKIVSLYANYWPLGRPTFWCATDGNWYNFCNSTTDVTIRAPLASVTTYANAKIMNDAAWKAANPGVTPPTVPTDPTTVTTPNPGTGGGGSTTVSDKGAILPSGFRTVWADNFTTAGGTLTNRWGRGVELNVAGQVTLRANTDDYYDSQGRYLGPVGSDSGAETLPPGYKTTAGGWGYGLYSFLLQTNAVVGGYALCWPGSDKWPGPEMDVLEITEGGVGYGTVHWKGSDGSNQYSSVMYNGVDTTQWHTYSMLWEPGRVTYHVDGVAYGSVNHDIANDYANGGENTCPGVGMQTWWNSGGARGSWITVRQIIYSVRG